MNNFFTLNAATYEDEKLLFDWINDIDVRRWSFNQNKILLNNHKTWFNNKINFVFAVPTLFFLFSINN